MTDFYFSTSSSQQEKHSNNDEFNQILGKYKNRYRQNLEIRTKIYFCFILYREALNFDKILLEKNLIFPDQK